MHAHRLAALLLFSVVQSWALEPGDKDSDADGLSDFAEVNKYFTNPARKDSDGDGIPDGDPYERREYSYSIRTVVRVMRPYDLAAMNDDYQDAKLLRETPEFGEIEVTHYPLNTVAQAISANPHWQKDTASVQEWLRPGISTNWTPEMRTKLLGELRGAGIDVDKLTDRDLASRVSRWMLDNTKSPGYMFTTYFMDFSHGKPTLLEGCEAAFTREKGKMGWSFDEQTQHEVFGAGMFENKTRGTCTSSAIYWTTVFRALGLPARHVLCIPAVDTNDPAQLAMIERGITHHGVRKTVMRGMENLHGFVSHSFNEVYVGGRWVRLNYSTLGQNILDERAYGLLTHTLTFSDLSEAHLAETWGRRYALGQRSPELPSANPFTTLEVTDRFGAHASITNPQVASDPDHKELTIQRAIWADSSDRPSWLSLDSATTNSGGRVIALVEPTENFPDQSYRQYRRFLDAADASFTLEGEDGTKLPARITGGFFTSGRQCEIAMSITRDDFAHMKPGGAFRLVPKNEKNGAPKWAVKDHVSLAKKVAPASK